MWYVLFSRLCFSAEEKVQKMEDDEKEELTQTAMALRNLADRIDKIISVDDPMFRAIRKLKRTWNGPRITIATIQTW